MCGIGEGHFHCNHPAGCNSPPVRLRTPCEQGDGCNGDTWTGFARFINKNELEARCLAHGRFFQTPSDEERLAMISKDGQNPEAWKNYPNEGNCSIGVASYANTRMKIRWGKEPGRYHMDLPEGKSLEDMKPNDWKERDKEKVYNGWADGNLGAIFKTAKTPWGVNHPSGNPLPDPQCNQIERNHVSQALENDTVELELDPDLIARLFGDHSETSRGEGQDPANRNLTEDLSQKTSHADDSTTSKGKGRAHISPAPLDIEDQEYFIVIPHDSSDRTSEHPGFEFWPWPTERVGSPSQGSRGSAPDVPQGQSATRRDKYRQKPQIYVNELEVTRMVHKK